MVFCEKKHLSQSHVKNLLFSGGILSNHFLKKSLCHAVTPKQMKIAPFFDRLLPRLFSEEPLCEGGNKTNLNEQADNCLYSSQHD